MLGKDFYAALGVKKTTSKAEIKDAFKRLASQYHSDRNKDEGADQRFKEISEAYAVLSDGEKRHLYDALGPDKYDDPREILFYRLNQAAANREPEREYESSRSAQQYGDAEGLGFVIFILLIIDFVIPSYFFVYCIVRFVLSVSSSLNLITSASSRSRRKRTRQLIFGSRMRPFLHRAFLKSRPVLQDFIE